MKIPRFITTQRKDKQFVYEFKKAYPSFYLYENKETGLRMTKTRFDLRSA